MIANGGECVYYNGDYGWWSGQQWGAGYEQVQYDCSGWEYQQQQPWETSGPAVGAELLTELRLAELKRLIDRDAKGFKGPPEVQDVGLKKTEQELESAECTTRASDSIKETPPKEGIGPADGAIAEVQVAVASTPSSLGRRAPGLEPPVEQRYRSLGDFLPESRRYGEMPVREGDEVFVDSEPLDGWIFGVKRGGEPDEGWLPASALGLADFSEEEEEEEDDEDEEYEKQREESDEPEERDAEAERQRRSRASGSRRGRGRGATDTSGGGGGDWCSSGDWGIGSDWGRGGGDSYCDRGGQQHGSNRRAATGQQQSSAAPQSEKSSSRRKRGGTAKAEKVEKEKEPEPAAAGRGGGGGRGRGGRGGERGPVERAARERPGLNALLDRLNQPLVPPKPGSGR